MIRPRVLLLLACAAWPGVAHPALPPVREAVLPNGLRVLLAPDSLAPGVDVAVWYRAGSLWEPPGASGLTHLLERLMFEGSKNVASGEHARRVRDAGGTSNATSGPDYSSVWQTVPSRELGAVLRLEADRMASLALGVATVREAKREAREDVQRRSEQTPLGRGLLALHAAAYPGHPYGRSLRGLDAERDALTLARVRAWWTGRYGPADALLSIAGRFDPDSVLALARGTVGAVSGRAAAATPPPAAAAPGGARASLRAETQVPLALLGWRAPAATDSGRVALRALSRLFAHGPASRLLRALARPDAALLLASEGATSLRREGSLLYAVALVRPGADSAAVENAARLEARRLATEAPSEEEMARVRREVELELRSELQTARGVAAALGTAELVSGDWREAGRDLDRAARLSGEAVRAMAERVFQPENAAVVWVWPDVPAAGGGAGR